MKYVTQYRFDNISYYHANSVKKSQIENVTRIDYADLYSYKRLTFG